MFPWQMVRGIPARRGDDERWIGGGDQFFMDAKSADPCIRFARWNSSSPTRKDGKRNGFDLG